MLAELVRKRLDSNARNLVGDIEAAHSLASTQQTLMSRSSHSTWQVLIAENQTFGIGRREGHWLAGQGQISFSIRGWVQAQSVSIGLLSLLASLCVRDVLTSLGLDQVQLKWPNDVLVNDKKISGLLISVVGVAQNRFDIVLGIGLNRVRLLQKEVNGGLDVISLSEVLPSPPEQTFLIACLLNAWFARLPLIMSEQGQQALLIEWQASAVWLGQSVIIIQEDKPIEGIFRGIALDGRLRLATQHGEQLFSVGEVRLRPLSQIN